MNYRKLRQFKGPPLACVSELWIFKEAAAGRMYLAMAQALEKYGSVLVVGEILLLTDRDDRFSCSSRAEHDCYR